MKKLLMVLAMAVMVMCTGCFSSVTHKNVTQTWDGLGVKISNTETVAIDAKDIPSFIKAVDKLEKLLRGE